MSLYLVKPTFLLPAGSGLPDQWDLLMANLTFNDDNAVPGVTWVHSYLTADQHKSFCLCWGPDPDAVRRAACLNNLPIDLINEVRLQTPYSIPPKRHDVPEPDSETVILQKPTEDSR